MLTAENTKLADKTSYEAVIGVSAVWTAISMFHREEWRKSAFPNDLSLCSPCPLW